jgi:nucleoside-diphosphate-sugar epimerase
MLYLVAGGAGFIGSNIVAALVSRGLKVRVLDNFSSGGRSNLAGLEDRIELIEGDIRDYWTVTNAMEGVNIVLHQAALPSVERSVDNPLTSNEVNINGTLNLLEAARRNQVKKFVYASSSSIYGDSPTLPKREEMKPQPLSPYAITKLAGEQYCTTYHRIYGLPTVSLRYFNVFGPRQNPNSQYAAVIPKFITQISRGEPPVIYGDGEQSRDFTYVSNVVEANLMACEAEEVAGEVINVACGASFNLNQLVVLLNQIMGTDIQPKYAPAKPGDVSQSLADVRKAQRLLGYQPHVDLHQGLTLTVEHLVGKRDASVRQQALSTR